MDIPRRKSPQTDEFRSALAIRWEPRDQDVRYLCGAEGIAGPGYLAPAPVQEGALRRGSGGQHGQSRSLLAPIPQDQVVQGPADALPPPGRAHQQVGQREGAPGIFGRQLIR